MTGFRFMRIFRNGYTDVRVLAMRTPVRLLLRNGYSLRCPRCHQGKLFAGWFQMRRECAICGLPYFRESGYYMGAMILNYGVTAFIMIVLYLLSLFFPDPPGLPSNLRMALWMGFAVFLSLALMRFSYSLWLSYDYWLEPWSTRFGPSTFDMEDNNAGDAG